MDLPTDRPIYESAIQQSWIDDDGILVSLSKSVTRTVENVKGNYELVSKITNGKPIPVIVFLTNSKKPSKETRDYVNSVLPKMYKAMAIVSNSGVGEFVMNFLFRMSKPVIPMKVFRDEKSAREWLRNYL